MSKIVLASFSKARAALLRAAGYHFEQHPSGEEERAYESGESPEEYVKFLATQKACAVARQFPDAIVLGADTCLFLEGKTYGKPHDLRAAEDMLCTLGGRTHQLCTGICVAQDGGHHIQTGSDTVQVTMRAWSRARIRAHVAVAQPLLYAGAYALQGDGCAMVERIVGDPNTVIGLPLALVETMIPHPTSSPEAPLR